MSMELQMEDRKQGHRSIEVFFGLVEVEIHNTEVDLQLGRVLLLLQQLHLCLHFLLGFLAFEFFLGLSRILLLLLVLLFLFFVF